MKTSKTQLILCMMLFFSIGIFSNLLADLANPPENPYPAHNATNVPLQNVRLQWSQTSAAPNQPYEYSFYMWASPKTIPGYTYKFTWVGIHYYVSDTAETWQNAKAICNSNKWRLGCAHNVDINNSMQTNNIGETTWIGLSDWVSDGNFRWEDGRALSYYNWFPGEPNNSGGTESYTEMYTNGQWNDASALSTHRYWIEVDSWVSHTQTTGNNYFDLNCKLQPNTTYNWNIYTRNLSGYGPASSWSFTTGADGIAPTDYPASGTPNSEDATAPLNPTLSWDPVAGATYYKLYVFRSRGDRLGLQHSFINGHVYQKTETELNYDDAKAAAEANGGHLVAINDAAEQAMLPNDYNYWIGLNDISGESLSGEGWFIWNVGEANSFTNWDLDYQPPEPNGQTAENNVIQGTSGKWYDVPGTWTYRSLIEYPADVLDGLIVYGTSYSFKETKLPANTLYRWIAVPYNEYGHPFNSTQWSFKTNNDGGTAPGTINSATISPLHAATNVPINTNLTWTAPSGSPTEYYAYLETSNTISNASNYTDLGIFNGHRYYKSNYYTWHWAAANIQAQKDGGYFATFGSAAEDAIFNGDKLWFGGSDRTIANTFKYANGDPWTYKNWYGGEPNNAGGVQYFTTKNHNSSNLWDDDYVGSLYNYAVEVAPNIANGTRVTSASYTPSLLHFNTTYYWSAVGSNANGMADDTQRWSFTTSNGKAINPTPGNSNPSYAGNNFNWDDVPGAIGYKIYIGTTSGIWDMVDGDVCPSSSYSYVLTFNPSTPYFWQIHTFSALEEVVGDIWSFTSARETELPVELSSFTAVATAQMFVNLQWKTESETNNLGFNVFRSNSNILSGASKINIDIISGTNTATVQTYNFVDNEIEPDATYYYWLEIVDINGTSNFSNSVTVNTNNQTPVMPTSTMLRNAYPNPFNVNSVTNIEVDVKAGETATLTIFNILGQCVKTYPLQAGFNQRITWNGVNSKGSTCGSGIYFYKLTSPSINISKKMLIVK